MDDRKGLKTELATYDRVYFVVDTFDECPFREELLDDILRLGVRSLSCLIYVEADRGRSFSSRRL